MGFRSRLVRPDGRFAEPFRLGEPWNLFAASRRDESSARDSIDGPVTTMESEIALRCVATRRPIGGTRAAERRVSFRKGGSRSLQTGAVVGMRLRDEDAGIARGTDRSPRRRLIRANRDARSIDLSRVAVGRRFDPHNAPISNKIFQLIKKKRESYV